jgi:predicted TIM-barrel fold metal-dependent hydrolase
MVGTPFLRIDSHAHVFERGLKTVRNPRYVPGYSATPEEYLAVLDGNGFAGGVLVQPSFLGADNSFLLSVLAAAPEMLRGVIVVNEQYLASELSEERLAELRDLGIRGVRLNLLEQPLPDLSARAWQEAAGRMSAYGWHLEIQAAGGQWAELCSVLQRWPSPLVIDHLGLPHRDEPDAKQVVLELANQEHVWIKVSAPYRSSGNEAESVLTGIIDDAGADRLLFGSDWPSTRNEGHTFANMVAWAARQLGGDLLEKVMTINPMRLFGWPDARLWESHPGSSVAAMARKR